jgi:uracil phosphoribosyltransferase
MKKRSAKQSRPFITLNDLKLINHPVLKRDVTILRNVSSSPDEFRRALRRISSVLAVEITREIEIQEAEVVTPLEKTKGHKLKKNIIIVPILRAGLGMVQGFLDILPDAHVGHIGIQRNEETLQPNGYYSKIPSEIEASLVILLDPMLATGGSASSALKYVKEQGSEDLLFACVVAAPEGVQKINSDHPGIKIYAAALDRELNSKGYILPGLGDAGDRTFGTY